MAMAEGTKAASNDSSNDEHERATDASDRSDPVRAAILSLLWPGLGHVVDGRARTGAAISASAGVATAAALWWLTDRSSAELTRLAVAPSGLRATIGVVIAILACRIAVLVDAVRPRGIPSARGRGVTMSVVVAVLVVMVAPHAVVATVVLRQLDTVSSVFTTAATEPGSPTPLPAAGFAMPPQAPTEPALEQWATDGGRLNVALLGGDAGFDRDGVRTDTIIVVSVDVRTGDTILFSIPRNWQHMPFPHGTPAAAAHPEGIDRLANAIYAFGSSRPELFPGSPDPGGTAVKQSLAQLLGLPVHYYVLVDMHAVVETVDLFGGLDIVINERVADGSGPIDPDGPPLIVDLAPGEHHLDGRTTLAYVRSRSQSSDYRRMSRQRCVLGALIDRVTGRDVLVHAHALNGIVADHVTTDIPVDDLPALVELAGLIDSSRTRSVNFIPPEYPQGDAPVADVRAAVRRLVSPAQSGVVVLGSASSGDGVDSVCEEGMLR